MSTSHARYPRKKNLFGFGGDPDERAERKEAKKEARQLRREAKAETLRARSKKLQARALRAETGGSLVGRLLGNPRRARRNGEDEDVRPPAPIRSLHREFLGREVDGMTEYKVPDKFPKDFTELGRVVAIVYETRKSHLEGGRLIQWEHEFNEDGKGESPMLAASEDGDLYLLGGDYFLTDLGIEG